MEGHVIIAYQGTTDLDHKVVSVSVFPHSLLNNVFVSIRKSIPEVLTQVLNSC